MDPIELTRLTLERSGLQGVHFDANDGLFFSRQLERIKVESYDVVYPELKARTFIPVDSSTPAGAKTITYRQFDQKGMARLTGTQADDVPLVTVSGKEFTQSVKRFTTEFSYNVEDIRAASMVNMGLDGLLAAAARRTIEDVFDYYAAFGNTALGTKGITNHASIPLVVLPNLGAFSTLTPQQILDNLNYLAGAIVTATKEAFQPDTLLVDTFTYVAISQMNVGVDNQMSVLRSFLANNPYIKSVDSWTRLNTAGATGKRRIIAYKKTPQVLQLNIPLEFTMLPIQQRGFDFVTFCEGKIGGLELHYPYAAAHADISLT